MLSTSKSLKSAYLLASTLLITLIFILSFRAFATHLNAGFNSDTAVHILMAHDLKFPQDLYYWGQDRLGSVVPILGNILTHLTPLSPLEAVSYVQYALLLVGFLCFSSLFKTHFSRLIFALAWFIPISYFQELVITAQPYGPQFAFTGIALVIINYILAHRHLKQWIRQSLIAIASLSLFISFWVSDLQFVLMAILAAMTVWQVDKEVNQEGHRRWSDRLKNLLIPDVITILSTSILGIAFILFAKESAAGESPYGGFSSLSEIIEVIWRLTVSALRTLTFQSASPFFSIYSILIALLTGYILYWWRSPNRTSIEILPPQWILLFTLNAAFSFGLILVSRWLYVNDVSLRYFSVVYVSVWMALLLLAEQAAESHGRRMLLCLFLIAMTSAFSQMNYVLALEKPPSLASRLEAVETLAPAGIIGEYWFSYVLCSTDPTNLKCTAYDREGRSPCPTNLSGKLVRTRNVRCSRCVRQVLESPQIYLVRNNWLKQFPQEIEQFGVCLVRAGKHQKVDRYVVSPYRIKEP